MARTAVPAPSRSASSSSPGLPSPTQSPGPPRAIVTGRGVVLPIVATEQDGWRVRTPCRRSTTLPAASAQELAVRVDVVLDPGHGGIEGGAVGANGVVEADVNLAVAQLTVARLEAVGYRAILTRAGDYRVPIVGRATIADALEALLASIHHNDGAANPSATPGTEAIYPRDTGRRSGSLG